MDTGIPDDPGSTLEIDPRLSVDCSGLVSTDPDDDSMVIHPEDSDNLIVEENIVGLNDVSEEAITTDLCEALVPEEGLHIIGSAPLVEVSELTSEEQSAWTAASHDLPLPGCYIYQCGDTTYKVTTTQQPAYTTPPPETRTCHFPGCGREFSGLGYLKIHQLVHNGEKTELVCPYKCGKTFSWPAHLKYHLLTHSGKRQYVCSVYGCSRSFYTNQRLTVHTRCHTGERPFICGLDGCTKTFTTAGNLKNHARVHSGEKPFACDIEGCTRSFAEFSSLKKHKVIHSGEKPFICVECGQQFTQSGSRNVHMKRYHLKETQTFFTTLPTINLNLTHPVTIATDNSDLIMSSVDSPLMINDIDGSLDVEDISEVVENDILTSESPTLIIVPGSRGDTDFHSDQVATISTQPHLYYQDTLELAETVLSDEGHGGKVIVEAAIINPEVTLSPF